MARPGRRPGNPDTRQAIVAAARTAFAQNGFDGTSMRSIAKAASVDPSLIHHYFDSKDSLLLAAIEIPIDPRRVIGALVSAGRDGLGVRIVETVLTLWDDPEHQPRLLGLLRSAATSDSAASLLGSGIRQVVIGPLAASVEGVDAAEAVLRAERAATQIVGLLIARHLINLEPVASQSVAEVAAWAGPTVQRYLDGGEEGNPIR